VSRARQRPGATRHVVAVSFATILLLLVCAAGLFAFLRWRARPVPTVAGWRARVFTLAGDGAPGARDDASATHARFADPFGVAIDKEGNLYVADAGASNRIRKVSAQVKGTTQGAVSTVAGGAEGFADGASASAAFNTPSGLALDRAGNLYVADTGNNRIRKVALAGDGTVTTIAGDGAAGFRDGRASAAEFNAPVGVATDERGSVYVADTYNDRIRVITPDGEVKTLAGGDAPGDADGDAASARFDTPCGVAVASNGDLFVADTGNNRIRKLTQSGQVSTVNLYAPDKTAIELYAPVGLALTHDGFLYVTEQSRGRIWQIAPDATARVVAGLGSGFADGDGQTVARFNQPAGVAVDRTGALYVADGANYLVRKIVAANRATDDSNSARGVNHGDTSNANHSGTSNAASNGSMNEATGSDNASDAKQAEPLSSSRDLSSLPVQQLPRLDAETLGIARLPYPLDPQNSRHEVGATMGEARGSFDSTDSRDHLHAGIDIIGVYGATVRAVFDEKVAGAISNWNFGGINEGLRVGAFTYYHLRVGRDVNDRVFDDPRFVSVYDAQGKLARIRVRRGARFCVGDALGTVNKMYHVHLNFGSPGNEINPLTLPLIDFTDHIAPQIARDGVQLVDAAGQRLAEKRDGRLVVRGAVSIVVDAFDQVDGNVARRRLGLYKLGFQILRADGSPAQGFDEPRVQVEFDRLPPERDAVKIAYADKSGITVYGSDATQFLYEATNTVRHGRAATGVWDASELPAGDYTLRILASDFSGNVATANRDVLIRIER
jgi:sugar lactone lactonase YvrE